jgi:hypothetical protein
MAAITGRHVRTSFAMSDQYPDPQVRVYFSPPPVFRTFGCAGCLIGLFVVGGIIGVLLFGWKTLLGM